MSVRPVRPAVPVLKRPRGGGLVVVRGYHYAAAEGGTEFFEAKYGHGPQCGDACPVAAATGAVRLAVEHGDGERRRGRAVRA